MAYNLLKWCLDPVVFVLILMAIGFFVSFRKEKKQSMRPFLIASFIVLYMASISPISNGICYLLEKNYFRNNSNNPRKLDIIIVLGGGISDNKHLKEPRPSNLTASRLLYAVQVFRKSGADYLVCAGKGKGKLTEAEVMCKAALRLGIPKQKIILDLKSRNTREHAEELNKYFNNKDLKIGLITSAYHMQRSNREFRKYFRNVKPLPSGYLYSRNPISLFTFLPHSAKLNTFSIAFREIIAIAWYKLI